MSSTDWTLPKPRKCWKCAKDLVWSTANIVLATAGVDWLEVDFGKSNIHLVRETCPIVDQPLHDWVRWKDCLQPQVDAKLPVSNKVRIP